MRIKCLLSVVLFTVGMVMSGAPKFQFRSYASENGLPANTILSMAQDHKGMIWVGTSDGICSFDGIEFIRQDLLSEGENKGINSLVGFNSPSYLSKCFSKEFGCSPYNWRKNARQNHQPD